MTIYYVFTALCVVYNIGYMIHCIKAKRVMATVGQVVLILALCAMLLLLLF